MNVSCVKEGFLENQQPPLNTTLSSSMSRFLPSQERRVALIAICWVDDRIVPKKVLLIRVDAEDGAICANELALELPVIAYALAVPAKNAGQAIPASAGTTNPAEAGIWCAGKKGSVKRKTRL
jgi:hypothetical protein